VVAMGRGGPDSPVVVDPSEEDLSPQGLVALADSGRHAASDYMEDAVMAGVTTIGTRRCGGGMAGRPAFSNFVAGVEVANERAEPLMVLEGSGHSMPPVHADVTILVASSGADPELLRGYMGPYRVLLSDLIVVTMDPTSLADSGARASFERDVRRLAQGVSTAAAIGEPPPIVPVRLVPTPLAPISGRRVVYVTTAPAAAIEELAAHLEAEHGAKVVGTSHHLADRPQLAADLEKVGEAEVLVTELKAAAVDLAARYALERGMEVVFCDNRVAPVEGGPSFDEMGSAIADMAQQRFSL
jgi:cyclic 2,3-diphosphoglycerate synthetase